MAGGPPKRNNTAVRGVSEDGRILAGKDTNLHCLFCSTLYTQKWYKLLLNFLFVQTHPVWLFQVHLNVYPSAT